jgi:hypothetical protein
MGLEPLLLTGAVLADKSLRHALLKPSATTLGKFADAWVEHLFAPLHPARLGNFWHHAAKAQDSLGRAGLEHVAAQPSFVEWAEGVSMIDPQDEELATIWLVALDEMRQGGHERLRLLDIAKQMRPDEALAFDRLVRARHKPGKGFPVPPAPLWQWARDSVRASSQQHESLREQRYLARFVAVGLLQSQSVRLRASGGLKLSATGSVVLVGAWGWSFVVGAGHSTPQLQVLRLAIAWSAFALGFAAMLSLARKLVNPPELSPEGEALAWKILDLRPTVAKPVPTSMPKAPGRASKAKKRAKGV